MPVNSTEWEWSISNKHQQGGCLYMLYLWNQRLNTNMYVVPTLYEWIYSCGINNNHQLHVVPTESMTTSVEAPLAMRLMLPPHLKHHKRVPLVYTERSGYLGYLFSTSINQYAHVSIVIHQPRIRHDSPVMTFTHVKHMCHPIFFHCFES